MKTPVSFPIAQLLKENGFDRVCNSRYWVGFENDVYLQVDCEYHNWNDYDDCSTKYYSAPTIEEVIMWLHEKHGMLK